MFLLRRLQPAIAGRHRCGKRIHLLVLPPPEEMGTLTIMTLDLALFRIWYRGHPQMHNVQHHRHMRPDNRMT
jgi:hypothetical protein